MVTETSENRVQSIRATDYSPKMVFDNLENQTTAELRLIQIFTQDNPSVHCTAINGVLHIELN